MRAWHRIEYYNPEEEYVGLLKFEGKVSTDIDYSNNSVYIVRLKQSNGL